MATENGSTVTFKPGENAPTRLIPNLDRQITCKVAEKGGVSIYGVNSFRPVTLYAQQLIDLLARSAQIVAFIAANKEKLAWKAESTATASGRTVIGAPETDSLIAMLVAGGMSQEDAEELATKV